MGYQLMAVINSSIVSVNVLCSVVVISILFILVKGAVQLGSATSYMLMLVQMMGMLLNASSSFREVQDVILYIILILLV